MGDLQKAYATQISDDDWLVYNNIDDIIYTLPKEFTEKQVMSCINFGRKFELTAYNIGFIEGKRLQRVESNREQMLLEKAIR